jgi:hypothetical protein
MAAPLPWAFQPIVAEGYLPGSSWRNFITLPMIFHGVSDIMR